MLCGRAAARFNGETQTPAGRKVDGMADGVADRIAEAIDKMAQKQVDNALIQVSIALDATARKAYGKGGRKNYQTFIHDNLDIITRAGVGAAILNIRLEYDLNRNQPADQPRIEPEPDGTFTIQQILYHAVRCGLLHESHLPAGLEFVEEQVIKVGGGDPNEPLLVLPAGIVYGLIVGVVAAPVNAGLKIEERFGLNIPGLTPLAINRLWGKKADILKLLDALRPFQT